MTRKAAVLIGVMGLIAALYLVRHISSGKASNHAIPAPQINLTDLNGAVLSPAGYRGQVVLINFWAAWCTPCRDEIPQMMALQERYRSRGFQTVGISMDDPEKDLRDFCREMKVNYPIVMGNQRIAEAFGGVLGLPTAFLIGRDGLIHARHEGVTDFPGIEREIRALLESVAD